VSGKTLRLILGDQLSANHSWFSKQTRGVDYVLMEVRSEASYVPHHIQKIVAFFSAMREFANELETRGFSVRYIKLSDPSNRHSLSANIEHLVSSSGYTSFEYQEPDELRVAQELKSLAELLSCSTTKVSSEHFLTTPEFFQEVFKGHKRYVMELFYREVRKRYDLLMEGDKPLGDRWNFDAENRKKLPAGYTPPEPVEFPRDVTDIVEMLSAQKIRSIGSINQSRFTWPVTRAESLKTLAHFCAELLPNFGTYQDAMHSEHRFLYHSKLSFALNVHLLSPLEVVNAAIKAFHKSKGAISLAQVEGFVRQIAGWREFMRGIYWTRMPDFKKLNFFKNTRPLPGYFWTGDTKMNCLKHSITQSLEEGYAHHIQRLMVTGNFALLAGIDPDAVDEWYLGIYIDAIEWVQLPNTRGMSQFADGGIVGTKPYCSSGQYINKMSNYCAKCFYNYKEKFGERGCPFNTLYWDFLMRNKELLEKNPRIGMGYQLLAKMSDNDKTRIAEKASEVLEKIEEL
jgi:deoxyribodipyrimidine photolyase-related protein